MKGIHLVIFSHNQLLKSFSNISLLRGPHVVGQSNREFPYQGFEKTDGRSVCKKTAVVFPHPLENEAV